MGFAQLDIVGDITLKVDGVTDITNGGISVTADNSNVYLRIG